MIFIFYKPKKIMQNPVTQDIPNRQSIAIQFAKIVFSPLCISLVVTQYTRISNSYADVTK